MQGIQNKYCYGEEGKMVFARNTPALQVCTIYQPTPLLTTSFIIITCLCTLYLDICLQRLGYLWLCLHYRVDHTYIWEGLKIGYME